MGLLVIIMLVVFGALIFQFVSSSTPETGKTNSEQGAYYTSWRMSCVNLKPESGKISFSEGSVYKPSNARIVNFTEIKEVQINTNDSTIYITLKSGEKLRLAIILNAKDGYGSIEDAKRMKTYVQKLQTRPSEFTINRDELVDRLTSDSKPISEKSASVVGRAVAGQIIAGPAGAVVGALSAVDKNNKNKK